jgi:pSer/pThr/pTyr-binding forkhead associated (FHA) protein
MGVRLEVRLDEGEDAPLVYELDQSRIALGRASSADVRLPHVAVSATHATIRVHNAGYAIFDESSTNGTFFEGTRIAIGRGKPLRTGDTIRIGPFVIVVKVGLAIGRATSSDGASAHARALLARAEGDQDISIAIENGAGKGRLIALPRAPAEVLIGRAEHADIRLDDADCSREHAAIVIDASGALLVDRESKNGLVVNGRNVRERRLRDRDEITIGATRLVYEDPLDPVLRGLDGLPDEPHVQPAPKVAEPLAAATTAAEPNAPEVKAVLIDADDVAPKAPKRPYVERRRDGMTDGLVYMLAGAVLALSLVGIYLLVSGT